MELTGVLDGVSQIGNMLELVGQVNNAIRKQCIQKDGHNEQAMFEDDQKLYARFPGSGWTQENYHLIKWDDYSSTWDYHCGYIVNGLFEFQPTEVIIYCEDVALLKYILQICHELLDVCPAKYIALGKQRATLKDVRNARRTRL